MSRRLVEPRCGLRAKHFENQAGAGLLSAELPFGAGQIVRGLCHRRGGCEMSAGWLAKGLVKAKCFVGGGKGRRGFLRAWWFEAKGCQACGAGGAVVGFVGKRADCSEWPQAGSGEAKNGRVASRAGV